MEKKTFIQQFEHVFMGILHGLLPSLKDVTLSDEMSDGAFWWLDQ